MAPKRAAPKSPTRAKSGAATKKVKVAKEAPIDVAAEIPEPVAEHDPFAEACKSLLDVIFEDPTLTKSARTMLSVAMPLALKPTRGERHKFQESMVTAIAGILHRVATGKEEGMNAAERQVADATSEQERAKEALETGVIKEAESKVNQKDAEAALQKAIEAVADAKKHLAGFHEREAEHEKTIALRAERDGLVTGTWAQLKEGAFKGKHWRERNRLIENVVRALEEMRVEQSCKIGLPVALKKESDQRGPIATRCIEYVDEQLQKYVQEVQDRIDQHDAAAEERTKALKDAEAKVTGAKSNSTVAQNELVAAENALFEATEAHKAMVETLKTVNGRLEALNAVLSGAKSRHAATMEVLSRFETIVEGGASVTAPKAVEETATEQKETEQKETEGRDPIVTEQSAPEQIAPEETTVMENPQGDAAMPMEADAAAC